MKMRQSDGVKNFQYFMRGDIIIYATVLLLIAAFTAIAFFYPKTSGSRFSVYYAGRRIFSASLNEDAEYIFYEKEGKGIVLRFTGQKTEDYNVISVRGGKVFVSEADCADGTCILLGATDYGEILCLPHKLKIVVEGKGLESDV